MNLGERVSRARGLAQSIGDRPPRNPVEVAGDSSRGMEGLADMCKAVEELVHWAAAVQLIAGEIAELLEPQGTEAQKAAELRRLYETDPTPDQEAARAFERRVAGREPQGP